ncbi:restriction endonuclease [Acetobacteraceae bacterium KSS8]|uniref:Restriction endonuclease n=1 Tax=Endosaccharibacter trunci TaxID=2812733 RepID=A0ABT1WBX2_9PROT|nr:restriction endonuclease [Acetobacteraceae bacterium KSS8]
MKTSLAAAGLLLLLAAPAQGRDAHPSPPAASASVHHRSPAHRSPALPHRAASHRTNGSPPPVPGWSLPAALALLLGSASAPLLRRRVRIRRRRRALLLVRAEIDRAAVKLRIRRLQVLGVERRGGKQDAERWKKEKIRFCDTTLRPVLARRGLGAWWPAVEASALRHIEHVAWRGRNGAAGFDPGMHPLDYERFCARLLEQAGWKTRLTPASGDQGADILATRAGCRLVVQCKLYRSAVGNDAVQQVAAARAHQGAQAAIVVSNARFTAAAQALARTNRVTLLHHEELRDYRPERAASDTIPSATR